MTTTPSHDKATPRENQDTRCITSAKVDMDVIPVDGQYQLLLPREPKGGGRGGGGKSGGIGRGGGAAAGGGRGDAGRAIFSVWEQGAILLIGMGLGFILLGAGWI